MPDLCYIVTLRLVESVVVFNPVVSAAVAIFEHFKDRLAI